MNNSTENESNSNETKTVYPRKFTTVKVIEPEEKSSKQAQTSQQMTGYQQAQAGQQMTGYPQTQTSQQMTGYSQAQAGQQMTGYPQTQTSQQMTGYSQAQAGQQMMGYPQTQVGQQMTGYSQTQVGQQMTGYPQVQAGQQMMGYPQVQAGQQMMGYPQAQFGQQMMGYTQAQTGMQMGYPQINAGAQSAGQQTVINRQIASGESGITVENQINKIPGKSGAESTTLENSEQISNVASENVRTKEEIALADEVARMMSEEDDDKSNKDAEKNNNQGIINPQAEKIQKELEELVINDPDVIKDASDNSYEGSNDNEAKNQSDDDQANLEQEEAADNDTLINEDTKQEPQQEDDSLINIEEVSMVYPNGTVALDRCSLKINKGEFVFIVGSSGSGKTTLIKSLLGEIPLTSGSVYVDGKELLALTRKQIPYYRRRLGVVFQEFRLLEDRNVYENVALAQRVIGISKEKRKKNCLEMLKLVGLSEKIKAHPGELSGGEQQRVAIARAMVNRPVILLADEPTGNLDPNNSWEIMKLLDQMNQIGATVVVVTHNDDIVNKMQKRVITLHKGKIISDEQQGGYVQ